MDEKSTAQATAESGATAETTAAESRTEEQTGQQQAGEQSQKTETTETKTSEAATASTGDKSKAEVSTAQKQEQKPLSRRSAQYRIQQLARENAELKKQTGQKQEAEGEEGETATDDQKPDIAALVQKEIERRLNPFLSESTKAADEAELSELFSGERASERSKYEGKIREMWALPQYRDVAASDLYKIASFDDAVKAATEKAIEAYKQAEKEAKESSGSGHSNTSNRTGRTAKSVDDLTPEQLEQHNALIKAGKPGLI